MLRCVYATASILLAIAATFPANAAELKIGLSRGSSSLDPHYTSATTNYEHALAIFDPLVRFDSENKVIGMLAESWRLINETTWEFKIRPNVKWHDGSPMTAEDVAFTYDRARRVPDSPSSLSAYLRSVRITKVVDPLTLVIETDGPAPAMLNYLVSVPIVSKKHGEKATTQTYNTMESTIGTGPYKIVSFAANDRMVVERNPDYWGGKPEWDKVTFMGMENAPFRMAAVIAGDIDVAVLIPPEDVERLKRNDKLNVVGRPANRVAYLSMDIHPEALKSGKILGRNGEKLDTNPLADKRVRQAMRLAINLDQFTDKIYRGEAVATGQYLQPGMLGFIEGWPKWTADEARAKKLLQESGWEGKFQLELGTTNSTIPLAIEAAQALAQAWTRIGIPTKVTSLPSPVFLTQRNTRLLPVYISSWTNPAGSGEDLYPAILHSRDTDAGYGTLNLARYSNPEVDKAIEQGLKTSDDKKRYELFVTAGKLALEDDVVFPLWSPYSTAATGKNIAYKARRDGLTIIHDVHPKQ